MPNQIRALVSVINLYLVAVCLLASHRSAGTVGKTTLSRTIEAYKTRNPIAPATCVMCVPRFSVQTSRHISHCHNVPCMCWGRLMNKGVTHVLIVRSTLERRLSPKFPAELKYQIVEVRSRRGGARGKESDCLTAVLLQVPEGPTENLILYFPECNACIQQAIAEGGKILVHCNAGLSRSAAVVVAYVRCAPLVGCCVRTRLWG